MSESAKRGRELFFSERLECFHCHGGFNFSQSTTHDKSVFTEIEFHNNGLYNIDGSGAYPLDNHGLWEFTFKPEDMGRFRAPTLRNIELTAPYMHDGSIATLEEVIDHYARGGRLISSGPLAGDGAKNPFKSEFIVGFMITADEKTDLINFLKSLTDWEFICDERFSDPFGNLLPHPHCLQ
jgi:cytochrome c peroxidase